MTTRKSRHSDVKSNPTPTLADRVKVRVAEAEGVSHKRSRESNRRHKHLRPTVLQHPTASLADSAQAQLEAQSLRVVYLEMRGLYRRYRRETGRPSVPELRSAVQAFNRGRSLKSLVCIATFLDDRKLLAW
jgi:hypothetical protein